MIPTPKRIPYRMIRVSSILSRPRYAAVDITPFINNYAFELIKEKPEYEYLQFNKDNYLIHPSIQKAYNYCVKHELDKSWLFKVVAEWPHIEKRTHP